MIGGRAWREYGVDWVQLDAPRHLIIHSTSSIEMIAKQAGLRVTSTVYDSTALQFWGSEQCCRGIALADPRSYAVNPEQSIFTPQQIAEYASEAERLNTAGDGDQACFYLQRAG